MDVELTPHPPYHAVALMLGPLARLERLEVLNPFTVHLSGRSRPGRVPWAAVARFDGTAVTPKLGSKIEN